MASQASLKELSKAISAFIPEPTVPLPDDLIETTAAYLRRHQKYDEAAADRLHDELQGIFDKHVRNNPSASGAWIGILRRLLPMIQTPERIVAWMDNFKGLLTRQSYDRSIVEETSAALMDLVALADEYQDIADNDTTLNPIMHRVCEAWMERFYPATVEGVSGMEYNERMFREALIQFGKKRPKQLFASINTFFIQRDHRKAALRFFCDFIQTRPPHLHQILHAPLFSNLLICLQEDTSTAVVSAALTALIMLLPHMPSSLVPYLPSLFNIYARILFWGRDKVEREEEEAHESKDESHWEVCSYVPNVEDASITHLSNYYTILYGLYPINFMDYIRKPQRYLRHANAANADDVAVQPTEIRQQSERFRCCHLLHPNFFTLTIDSEKTDFGRFIKSEASEVVAECMALCLSSSSDFGAAEDDANGLFIIQSPTTQYEQGTLDGILLKRSISIDNRSDAPLARVASNTSLPAPAMARHNSQSSQASNGLAHARSRDSGPESTSSPPPYMLASSSHTHLQDMIQSNKTIKSGLAQSLRNGSEVSLPLNYQENEKQGGAQGLSSSVKGPLPLTDAGSQVGTQIALLQRQNLMLQNDLSFERYQKQQHMAHIADLRRKLVAEAATEAETQNLILTSRNLKRRYDEAKQAEMQVRKESEKSRTLAKKWEGTLSHKMKKLREEYEQSKTGLEQVKKELEISQQEADKLRRLVCMGEVKEINWRQNVQYAELQVNEIDRLKGEVDRLTIVERDNQAKEMYQQSQEESAQEAEKMVEKLRMELSVRDDEVRQTKDLYQSQVKELQTKLFQLEEQGGLAGSSKADVQAVLAGSRAKQAELQTQYDLLKRKYTALLSSVLDMESGNTPEQIRNEAPSYSPTSGDYPVSSGTPLQLKLQPRRGPLSPPLGDSTAFNTTPPLDTRPTSLPPAAAGSSKESRRPSTPSTQGGEGLTVSSPDHRLFGRGGVQNKIRKDSKGKQKEEEQPPPAGKKEKKSGLRGIRGLV